ncbi:oleosin S1-2-like [Cynara cardunculus var. scolymus]|uniref:Oleosin n=1 Tax=Cynara cardunculus var. scolymus TaxID=59895 RepID=A0A103Y4G9_CYNCS|nr:oleosin S1-2-like [Cynara cardunculus var. scolymus]KVI02354.1 Oleosin [Cynara cardunculus var. scolymus]
MALRHRHRQVSTKTILLATVAGITVGGPLLALMAFSFLTTMALFVVTSPLLIIFSPLLMAASFVFLAALVGFGAAGLMAIAGLSALSWVLRSVKDDGLKGLNLTQKLVESGEKLKEKVVESGENVMDTGKDWVNHLKQPVENSPENKTANKASENVKDTGKDWANHLKQTAENSAEIRTADTA